MLKLCINGGFFGKLNQKGSFLYYPEGMLLVTIGCQMEIMMLIEMLEEAGIQVVSGNTDGVVSYYPEEKRSVYEKVCKDWEKRVGNTTLGQLEYAEFQALWQESINHYIGLKTNGEIKKKGRFMTEYELHKNKSKLIIPMALEQWFIHRINPIEYIRSHDNIYNFCIARKSSRDMYYEEEREDGEKYTYKKLVRYYVSTEGGVLYKRGHDHEGKRVNNNCEAIDKEFPWVGQPRVTYFNRYFSVSDFKDYKVDYNYYILQTLKRIDKIEKTDKARRYAATLKTKQTSLF
jgi:hypothetical protein